MSQSAFAYQVGVSQATVSLWEGGTAIPPESCKAIESITGITCELLRADLTWLRDDGHVTGYCKHFD